MKLDAAEYCESDFQGINLQEILIHLPTTYTFSLPTCNCVAMNLRYLQILKIISTSVF